MLTPDGCAVTRLAAVEEDVEAALDALASELGALNTPPAGVASLNRPTLPTGAITSEGIAQVLAALMPDDAIVMDESITVGRSFSTLVTGTPPHDWLNLMGGSIGWGLPVATGAAVAAPQRKVIVLEGDGSAMYTLQALWTMARENLNVMVMIFANRAYRILHGELANVGAGTPGRKAIDMLTLDRPDLEWVALAKGCGVDAGHATTLDELAHQFKRGLSAQGPYLIEVAI